MNFIKLSLDNVPYNIKPQGSEVSKINNRIANAPVKLSTNQIRALAESIGQRGMTFCPATFTDGKRDKDHFEQQQFIALDFDNKDPKASISLDEAKARANHYGLPFLFAYDTLTSENHNKFRIVFLNNAPMGHRIVAEAVQLALGKIFPEADPSCYKDTSKMYFGGKELTYFDEKSSTIDVESVFRSMTRYLKESTPTEPVQEQITESDDKVPNSQEHTSESPAVTQPKLARIDPEFIKSQSIRNIPKKTRKYKR